MTGRAFLSLDGTDTLQEVHLVAVQLFVRELAQCPHLASLRRLDLAGNRIGASGIASLLASPFLANVQEVGLAGNELADLPPLPCSVVSLNLSENHFTHVPSLPTLVELDLSKNPLRQIELPTSLQRLRASRCGLPLESLDSLHTLTELDMSFNEIESFDTLAGLSSLVSLNLRGNRVCDIAPLAESECTQITSLSLAGNPIGDRGVVALLQSEALANLMSLDIENVGVTNVARLCATGALGGLQELSLAWNPCDPSPLAQCPDLAGLRILDLRGTPLTFAGAVALADSPHLGGVRTLRIGENPKLPAGSAAMLRERFGTISS